MVVDFMPRRGSHADVDNSDIVRIVCGLSGRVTMKTELVLRFDHGQAVPWATRLPDGTFRAIAGPDMVVMHTPVALHGENLKTVATSEVAEGQRIPLVLTHGPSHLPAPSAIDPEKALQRWHSSARWCSISVKCGCGPMPGCGKSAAQRNTSPIRR
jgi:hypothetical protein